MWPSRRAERFRSQLFLVACGFDANAADPLARMLLSSSAFSDMTRQVREQLKVDKAAFLERTIRNMERSAH
ncbi:hypothetical protein LLY24_00775 [Halomonas sp. wenzhen-202101]|uniref:Histone deacetylase domain-containing protein n=1 Tax=Halomonas dongshanensis TaxID=2890835 RepID=A0ABT2E8M5_9GAMM|nr:hypothetical protein [Halomonas dongshanensis]